MHRKKITPLRILIILAAVIAVAVVVIPYIWMILTSFKTTPEIMRNPDKIFPIEWVLSGYKKVLTQSPFFHWFLNSVIVSVSVTLIVLFTSSITGYIFAKYHFRFKKFLFWLILASMMVPFSVTMIPNFLIVNGDLEFTCAGTSVRTFPMISAKRHELMGPEISGFTIPLCCPSCGPAWHPWLFSPSWKTGMSISVP